MKGSGLFLFLYTVDGLFEYRETILEINVNSKSLISYLVFLNFYIARVYPAFFQAYPEKNFGRAFTYNIAFYAV